VEATELLEGLPAWVGYLAVGAPGAWAVIKLWIDGRKDQSKQRADLIKIAQEAAASVIEDLQAHIDRLQARIATLEAELSTARREHTDSIAAKDAEIALLRGEVRQWQAIADTYERQLTDAGVPHEKPSQPVWRVPPGTAPTDVSPV
jgi:hypothetical protein